MCDASRLALGAAAVRLGGPLDLGTHARRRDVRYVSYYPHLVLPGAPDTVGAFAELAVGSGAGRPVLLAGRGERGAEAAEDAARASGADLTIVAREICWVTPRC